MTETPTNDRLIRILQARDVTEYVARLSDEALFDAVRLPEDVDFSSLRTTRCKWSALGKALWVKRWFRASPSLFPEGVKLHFPLRSRHGCHMDDKGNVTFPLSVFFKRFAPFVKYVFHESAHLYLSKRDDYPELLALDAIFRTKYSESAEAICLSPVEHIASRLSIRLLESAAASVEGGLSERLLNQRDIEERKLSRAIALFESQIH